MYEKTNMTPIIKIFLFTLALVAGLFALNFFGALKNTYELASIFGTNENTQLASLDNDVDGDGLTNREESYWNTDFQNPDTDGDGYLDGEEVAARHDPRKPGPDDKLLAYDTTNITDKVSSLITAGVYAGDLKADAAPEIYNQALADISIEVMSDGMKALDPNNAPIDEVILSSDSKEAQEEYLNAIGLIIQNIWGEIINEPVSVTDKFVKFYSNNTATIDDSKNYFNSKAYYYKDILADLNAITVPPSWLNIHRQVVSNIQTLIVSHQTIGQTAEDPLKGVLGMNNLVSMYQNIQPILVSIAAKIEKNNLNPPNGQLWNLIESLTNGF
jgi:hypothetical protein